MNKLLFAIYLAVLFISFCATIINRKNLTGRLRLFTLLTGVTFLIECTGFYLLFYTRKPTFFLYHFYLPFAYSVLAFIYAGSIRTGVIKRFIEFSIPGFVALHLFISLFIQKTDSVNTYGVMAGAILFVALALIYFYDLLQKEGVVPLLRNPLFWVSSGNLIFYAGVFFLMGLLNYIIKELPDLAPKLMYINYSLNYILYTLYSIGFLCTIRNRRSSLL